jgi:hypothetical protein
MTGVASEVLGTGVEDGKRGAVEETAAPWQAPNEPIATNKKR